MNSVVADAPVAMRKTTIMLTVAILADSVDDLLIKVKY